MGGKCNTLGKMKNAWPRLQQFGLKIQVKRKLWESMPKKNVSQMDIT
jgi:hypothetical protein